MRINIYYTLLLTLILIFVEFFFPILEEAKMKKFNRQKSFTESIQSELEKELDEEKEMEEYYSKSKESVFMRVLKMNKPEWLYLFWGVIASICVGGFMQSFGVLFGQLMAVSVSINFLKYSV